MPMSEIVIKEVINLPKSASYVASIIIVTGEVLQNEEWYLKSNPKLKIVFKSPVIIKGLIKEKYFLDFTIDKPDFDLSIFNKPTTWIKNKGVN